MADAAQPSISNRIGQFVEGEPFQRLVMALIVLNGITLGLQTAPSIEESYGGILAVIDAVVLVVFVIELVGKLIHQRLQFFKDGWNIFDFLVIGLALMPASGDLAVLRALRILRVLRLISVVPALQRVVRALLKAVPGMAGVVPIIALIFYIGAVLCTKMFGETFPDWFGTIGASMYTLFQIMTLESWSMGIVRPVMDAYPHSWLFFVPFIIVTSFAVLNLFIGIIVDAMQSVHEEDGVSASADSSKAEEDTPAKDPDLAAELAAIRSELVALRSSLQGSDKA